MSNHDIIGPALQKYYSALKSLDDFARIGDFYDDISNLDKFFSEFRNITFVIQKGLGSEENKQIYEALREECLKGDVLKWFVNIRNKTTKEKPFELTKELAFDVYLPGRTVSFQDERLVIDFDSSFNEAVEYIQSIVLDKLKMVETFFTVHIIFKEDGNPKNLYGTIKEGLIQMDIFMNKMSERFPCECERCSLLKQKTEELYHKMLSKELLFTRDYSIDSRGNINSGIISSMFVKMEDTLIEPLSIRTPLKATPIFIDQMESIEMVFLKFITMHVMIFRMSEHHIMPTFMVVYNDKTFRMGSFIASTKATFYRKVNELINLPDIQEVVSFFCCNESYTYGLDKYQDVSGLPYDTRIKNAEGEVLSFIHITGDSQQTKADFDIAQIDKDEYVANVINAMKTTDFSEVSPLDWLNPIRKILNLA